MNWFHIPVKPQLISFVVVVVVNIVVVVIDAVVVALGVVVIVVDTCSEHSEPVQPGVILQH